MGRTRRVLLSDTLLDDFSDDEIEVIVAHEIAHDVRGDVWWSLAGRGLVMGGALWMAQQALTRLPEPFWRQRPGDPESLPLAALVTFVGVGCCRPVLLAMSRWHERQADRLALELTNQPDAFISAVQRMSARNLSDEEPTTWQRVLFYGHPPVRERLARARAWANRDLSEPSPPARRSSSGSPHRS
jgi:STE24 endopeptidase